MLIEIHTQMSDRLEHDDIIASREGPSAHVQDWFVRDESQTVRGREGLLSASGKYCRRGRLQYRRRLPVYSQSV